MPVCVVYPRIVAVCYDDTPAAVGLQPCDCISKFVCGILVFVGSSVAVGIYLAVDVAQPQCAVGAERHGRYVGHGAYHALVGASGAVKSCYLISQSKPHTALPVVGHGCGTCREYAQCVDLAGGA